MVQKNVSSNPRWGQLATGKLSVRPAIKGTFFKSGMDKAAEGERVGL